MFRGFRFLNMKFGTKLLSGKISRTFEEEKTPESFRGYFSVVANEDADKSI